MPGMSDLVSDLLIIKTGSAPPAIRDRRGDFEDWFKPLLAPCGLPLAVVDVAAGQVLPKRLDGLSGAVITGSAAMVSDAQNWSERTARWLTAAHHAGLPLLGVCYGHQLLAHALGGTVGPNPNGRHMGTRRLQWAVGLNDRLMGRSPIDVDVQVTHLEVVLKPPAAARVLARLEHDRHAVLYFGQQSWGVQFHPEFDRAIMAEYIIHRRAILDREGCPAEAWLKALREAPFGVELLARFARLARLRKAA